MCENSERKTDLSKYIVNVQGKDFVTFPGLLAEAHAQGLTSIKTDLVNTDLTNPVIKATVTVNGGGIGEKTFTGYGDACSTNVAKKVAGALLRMAETRAIARALRFACNIDMTAIEELDAEEPTTTKVSPPITKTFVTPSKTFTKIIETKGNSTTQTTVVTPTEVIIQGNGLETKVEVNKPFPKPYKFKFEPRTTTPTAEPSKANNEDVEFE